MHSHALDRRKTALAVTLVYGHLGKSGAQVGDPSYFPGKVRRTSSVVRAVCLLSHPISATNNAASVQIILPQKQARIASPCQHP